MITKQAAEQEIEECIQKIDDIQYIFDNPANEDCNMAYEEKKEDLKCMQEYSWEKMKQLLLEIRNIQEYDDMDDKSDTRSVSTKSSNTTGKDPTTANIHPNNSNTVPKIDTIFADSSSNKCSNSGNIITKTNWKLPKNVQQPLIKQHPLYKITHGLIQNQ